MKIKKLCTVALLSLLSFYAKAQIWQAYRGVWLKGYDNATQAPIPPTGYSALTYFADSLGTYVYDWDSLAWLRIPGTGGSGGGLATADNGLTVNPTGNVRLGGPLIENTNITGNFALNLGTAPMPLSSLQINAGASSSDRTNLNMSANSVALGVGGNLVLGDRISALVQNASQTRFTIDSATNTATNTIDIYRDKVAGAIENVRYFTLSPTQTRFNTNSIFLSKTPTTLDTAQWFLARDFTTGEIVQRKMTGGGGGFVTADNGLTASSPTNVQLGGTLIQNTTIPLGGFSYTVGQFPDNVNFSVNDASNTITANLSAGSSGALFSMTASNAVLQHSGASGTATLTLNQSTETATISSSSGSQVDFNVATPASPVITTQAAENFTISKPLGLMSSSGSLQIGGPDGLVTSLENTESGNTAIFDVRGTNETFAMRSGSGGSTLTVNVANPALVNLSATGSNATLIMQAENGFQIFDPEILVSGGGINEQLQIGRLNSTRDDGIVRIYYTGRTGEIELGVLAGGPFIRGTEDNQTFRVEAVGANSNIVVKAGAGGFVIMEDLPTTDPCGSAPSGTIWDNSGVLNRCP